MKTTELKGFVNFLGNYASLNGFASDTEQNQPASPSADTATRQEHRETVGDVESTTKPDR